MGIMKWVLMVYVYHGFAKLYRAKNLGILQGYLKFLIEISKNLRNFLAPYPKCGASKSKFDDGNPHF